MLWVVGMNLTVIFQCTPIRKFWEPHVPGHCIDLWKFLLAQAIPNIFTDLVILLLPLPPLWNLQVPSSQKAALFGIFLLGYS